MYNDIYIYISIVHIPEDDILHSLLVIKYNVPGSAEIPLMCLQIHS